MFSGGLRPGTYALNARVHAILPWLRAATREQVRCDGYRGRSCWLGGGISDARASEEQQQQKEGDAVQGNAEDANEKQARSCAKDVESLKQKRSAYPHLQHTWKWRHCARCPELSQPECRDCDRPQDQGDAPCPSDRRLWHPSLAENGGQQREADFHPRRCQEHPE